MSRINLSRIEQGWYNGALANYWLAPLSLLFWLLSSLRRRLFALGWLKSVKAAKPVIVVGNISVGGNGKTPFVIWLVQLLQAQGYRVGVISRGYGGHSEVYPLAVDDSLDTSKFGDEPVLIYKRTGAAVVVGSDRVKSCRLLTAEHKVDVIVSDDGLQHYRLGRDIEIVIVDAAREFGNGWLMPVGPLRESKKRLKNVDYVIYNGSDDQAGVKTDACFTLAATQAVNMISGHHNISGPVHGLCGIGNPQRFEQTLAQFTQANGLTLGSFSAFADHHQFCAADLSPFGEKTVLMTEKDAVKCQPFAQPNWWYLPVDPQLTWGFEPQLLTHIRQVINSYGI